MRRTRSLLRGIVRVRAGVQQRGDRAVRARGVHARGGGAEVRAAGGRSRFQKRTDRGDDAESARGEHAPLERVTAFFFFRGPIGAHRSRNLVVGVVTGESDTLRDEVRGVVSKRRPGENLARRERSFNDSRRARRGFIVVPPQKRRRLSVNDARVRSPRRSTTRILGRPGYV